MNKFMLLFTVLIVTIVFTSLFSKTDNSNIPNNINSEISNPINSNNDLVEVEKKINFILKSENQYYIDDLIIRPLIMVGPSQKGGYVTITNDDVNPKMQLFMMSTLFFPGYNLKECKFVYDFSKSDKKLLKKVFLNIFTESDIVCTVTNTNNSLFIIFFKTNDVWYLKAFNQ